MSGLLKPVIVPMYTPFDEDGSLDEGGVVQLINWLTGKGVRAIYVRSGVGGKWKLRIDEVKRLAEISVWAAEGRAAILVGCEGEWSGDLRSKPDPAAYTEGSCELAEYAEEVGADGIFLAMPMALDSEGSDPVESSIRYFSAVRSHTSLPILLHQLRGTPEGFKLSPDLLKGLLELGGFLGIKVSTDDPSELGRAAGMMEGTGFALICGNERLWLEALKAGAVSVIGGGSNVYPELMELVYRRFKEGDVKGAERLQRRIWELLDVTRELPGVFWRQYLILKGVEMKPFDRDGQKPLPDEVVREAAERVDRILSLVSGRPARL